MAESNLPERLRAWRAAERALADAEPGPAADSARQKVARAWLAYQDAALARASGEFLLLADDQRRYVGATSGVRAALGYDPEELIGRRIEDLTAPAEAGSVGTQWLVFLADGSMEGAFRLRSVYGQVVPLLFHARANHPVAGLHASWLSPAEDPVRPDARREPALAVQRA